MIVGNAANELLITQVNRLGFNFKDIGTIWHKLRPSMAMFGVIKLSHYLTKSNIILHTDCFKCDVDSRELEFLIY